MRYTAELARALGERYPSDTIWLLSDQPFRLPEATPGNVRQGERPRTPIGRKWWLWGLQQEMMHRRVDVFHGTDFSVPYLPFRPSVMTLHDLSPWLDPSWQPEASRIRTRTPLLLRAGLATMVITPSEAVRRAAIDRFRLSPDRVIAIPEAASERFHRVAFSSPATPYFLFVGTLEPRKNLPRLIDAWRGVRKSHPVDLVIAGRSRPDFPPIAPEPGLHLRGPVEESELPSLYSAAVAVVYPSLYEGFGLPVLEAMQCGAIVITSKDPAIGEVADDSAIRVDAEDAQGLTEAMRAVAAEPAKFADFRQLARARAECFSWRKTAERPREVYDAALRVFRK